MFQGHLKDLYDVQVSPQLISEVTDARPGRAILPIGEAGFAIPGMGPARDLFLMILDHDRLEVYQLARQLRREVLSLTAGLPRGNGEIVDQLNRAALSIKLNIAEGTGEFAVKEKARFYRMARRSAAETGAGLDDLEDLGLRTARETAAAQALTARVVGGLVRLIQTTEQRTPPRTYTQPGSPERT